MKLSLVLCHATRLAPANAVAGLDHDYDDRRKPIIIDEKIEHFAISFTFDY
jgi:hypothetical protein